MATAKAKSNAKKPKAMKPYVPSHTFEQLHWSIRMLNYIATDLETDYNKIALTRTTRLTKRDVPDLFTSFHEWVMALSQQYELTPAMEIYGNRYRDCMKDHTPFNDAQGEIMRLAFHHTFPGQTIEGVMHFQKYCMDIQFRDGCLETVYFEAYSDEEAFDAVIQAYLEQDETIPDDMFWKPIGLGFMSRSGNYVNISQVFFSHSAGIVDAPKPAMSADARAFVDKATDHPSVVGKTKPQNPPDDKDEDGYPLPFDESMISIINAVAKDLFDDIDSGKLEELAKKIALNG